ncbi:acyltransferase family protein [Legionella brunensis]|uniref:Putative Heparan-alpha-glucosaminide N-acetyltransferase n=1 Tax=Legionella brunensis TaxID=29422 RepID=A0A0W0STE2_9GAMM|nr:heparan-alpha-glucosaminide N-acetyltransferase domain-containing protein [Legionella brunensis]KTC86646.1 putative Heparan-alpha-glucosaminide N-acetyltransferase [Legionella brunensis]
MTAIEKKISRLLSLDVFRGLTIALMILINSPGNPTAYAWLEHSEWNGCTLADVVFPFFIFIVGVSLVFSLTKAKASGLTSGQLLPKIIRRSFIIFLIGLLLNAFPNHFDLVTLRVYGVLQRIAICYFVCAMLFLTTRISTQIVLLALLLIGYWLLMTLVPVPGYGLDDLTPQGNLAAYVDRMIFSANHLYGKFFDPEGLLSTLPTIATGLIGNLTGFWLLTPRKNSEKFKGMIVAGILSLVVGWFWGLEFPINKALWTSSYVLWTGGLALLVLGLCYWLIEIKGWKKWSKPLEIFGVNALAVYFLHILLLKIQLMITTTSGNLRLFITDHLFGWASMQNASLFYALTYTLFWLFILTILYRKKIFIKI